MILGVSGEKAVALLSSPAPKPCLVCLGYVDSAIPKVASLWRDQGTPCTEKKPPHACGGEVPRDQKSIDPSLRQRANREDDAVAVAPPREGEGAPAPVLVDAQHVVATSDLQIDRRPVS